jgi:senataxin
MVETGMQLCAAPLQMRVHLHVVLMLTTAVLLYCCCTAAVLLLLLLYCCCCCSSWWRQKRPYFFIAASMVQGRVRSRSDPKQLAAVVKISSAARQCYSCSLFECLQLRGSHVAMLLNTQYRCRPEISLWPRQQFYGGQLQDGPNVLEPSYGTALQPVARGSGRGAAAGLPCFKPFEVIDVCWSFEEQGSHSKGSIAGPVPSTSISNPMEVDTVMWRLQQLLQQVLAARAAAAAAAGALPVTVGIITGYQRQVAAILEQCRLLSQRLASSSTGPSSSSASFTGGSVAIGPLLVDVQSVSSFQGQERDVIIFSAVRANDKSGRPAMGFMADPRRLNVALTRPRHMLAVVGNARTLSTDPTWAGLLASAGDRGLLRVLDCTDEAAAAAPQNADCRELLEKLQQRQRQ